MNKYQQWWNNLSPHMQEYLEKQPMWYDRDLYKSFVAGIIIGFALGYITKL